MFLELLRINAVFTSRPRGKTERNHTCQWLSQSRSSCSCLIWSIAHSFSERLDVDWVFCWAACATTWACRPKLSSVVGLNDGFVVVFSLSCLMCHVLMYFLCLKESASTCNARSEGILNTSDLSLRQVYSGLALWGGSIGEGPGTWQS